MCIRDRAKGVKTSKERVTVFCCVSMSGAKEELFVIGKSEKPRCFKGVKKLPVRYFFNKNAWMTLFIFIVWLKEWHKKLKRKILLLVDNCSAHKIT